MLAGAEKPLAVVVAGLDHGHAAGFFGRYLQRADVRVLGVAEPNEGVRKRYFERYRLDPKIAFASVEEMLRAVRPEVVLAYTNTADHLKVVEVCAAQQLPVMMEKPLAIGQEQALRMKQLADRAGIPVMVNYETTWYASNAQVQSMLRDGRLGQVRKVVIHDGHQGPKEINVPDEFFAWLTDPLKNGAGALFDFGCYGANLMTWLMNNQRPKTVTAVTQQIKPDIYTRVDDEATIVLTYPSAQAIVQASWNWPYSRKDMEVYGTLGSARTLKTDRIALRKQDQQEETTLDSPKLQAPYDDAIRYAAAVVRKQIPNDGLSSLENNIVVTEILDAARRSAASGKAIQLS